MSMMPQIAVWVGSLVDLETRTQFSHCIQNAFFSLGRDHVKYPETGKETGCISLKISDEHNMFNSSTVKLRLSTDELAVYSDLHTTCIIYKSSSLLLLGLLTFGVSVASLVAASFLGSGSGSGWTVRLRSVGGAGALQMLSIAAASSPVAAIFSTHDHMTRAVSRDFSFPSFFLMQ